MKIKDIALLTAATVGLISVGGANFDAIGDKIAEIVGGSGIEKVLSFGDKDRSNSQKGVKHTYTVKTDPKERIIGPYLDAETRTISLFGDVEGDHYVDAVGIIGEDDNFNKK